MGFLFMPPTIVGGTVLVISDIRSQNYVPGVSGWAIFADGTAEFLDIVIRGSLITGTPPNRRIEINGSAFPNSIAFYTGNTDEDDPGRIEPTDSGGLIQLTLFGPSAAGGGTALLNLEADTTTGDDRIDMEADDIDIAAFTVRIDGFDPDGVAIGDGSDYLVVNGANVRILGEVWHVVGAVGEPAFAGNWVVQGGSTVAFYKDATGRVQLRGRGAEPVALSATIFTLPVGYRPTQIMSWAVKANNDAATVGWVQVSTTGAVSAIGNVAALRVQTILDTVSFPTF